MTHQGLTWLVEQSIAALRPPRRMTVSQWADRFAYLPRRGNAEPGKYHVSRFPPQAAMLDDALDSTSSEVVWMIGSQLGKTLCYTLIAGYFVHQDPTSILVVYPKIADAITWMRDKFEPLRQATPAIRHLIRDARERNSENTMLSKGFPGGEISAAGANSASTLRQRSKRIIICDEIDSYENNDEGDPIEQADMRAANFCNAVRMKASTPTYRHASRIEALYDQSDKNRWFCPCPRCGHWQALEWRQLKFTFRRAGQDVRDVQSAVYICEQCQAELSDSDRIDMINAGEWRATAPFNGIRGRHLSGLYRVIGKKSAYKSYLHEFADHFLKAKKKGDSSITVWTNTFLAEPREADVKRADIDEVLRRCELYAAPLPAGVLCLVGAVDVQANRLEYQVVGFGLGDEAWAIDRQIIPGDPHLPLPWRGLEKLRRTAYLHANGKPMSVASLFIDSGGQVRNKPFTRPVYSYVLPRQPQNLNVSWGVFACKGSAASDAPICREFAQQNKIRLMMVGVSEAKSLFFERLNIAEPGPGYIHFPRDERFDPEYFAQLSAEEARVTMCKGYARLAWYKLADRRNEALDLWAYCLAAFDKLRPNWQVLTAKYGAATFGKKNQAAVFAVAPAGAQSGSKPRVAPKPTRRRHSPFRRKMS